MCVLLPNKVSHMLHESEETHRWPHSRTLRLTSIKIRQMRNWMITQECEHYHIHVRRRAYTAKTGEYAVVVHCRDLTVWPQFVLTWL